MLKKVNSVAGNEQEYFDEAIGSLHQEIRDRYQPVLRLANNPIAIFHSSTATLIEYNHAFQRLTRLPGTSCRGKQWSDLFTGCFKSLKDGEDQLIIDDASQKLSSEFERIELQGEVYLLVKLFEKEYIPDSDRPLEANKRLYDLSSYHQAILNSTPNGFLLIDRNFNLLSANRTARQSFARLLKMQLEEGEEILDLVPEQFNIGFKHYCKSALRGESSEVDRAIDVGGGDKMWFRVNFNPAVDRYHEVFGVTIVVNNITRQRNAEQKLNEQNKELQKTNRELDKFVYSVSHDLRAPIANTIGLATIMKAEGVEGELRTYVDMIESTMRRMDSFIYQILDYSRNNRLELKLETIHFKSFVDSLLEDLYYYNREDIAIDFQLNIDEKIYLVTDKHRLGIIMNNLLSNAIKYHDKEKDNPYVKLSVSSLTEKLVIVVEDNGQGIDSQYLPNLFEMFFTANLRAEGSGIGLYILKDAVEQLNGRVEVSSELSSGSCFTVELPKL